MSIVLVANTPHSAALIIPAIAELHPDAGQLPLAKAISEINSYLMNFFAFHRSVIGDNSSACRKAA